ncbi:MAG TPA: polyhydroxyalkanoate granule-associated phasin [Casimicrobiaceae bacterium]
MRRSSTRRRSLRKATELALVAPQVVALRTFGALASGANPTARDRREWTRMGTEKTDAFAHSIAAMNAQWMRWGLELPFVLMRESWSAWLAAWMTPFGRLPRNRALERHWRAAAARAFAGGLSPVHRAAVANLRRLNARHR